MCPSDDRILFRLRTALLSAYTEHTKQNQQSADLHVTFGASEQREGLRKKGASAALIIPSS
jgi:hypothetical protein